MIDYTLEVKLYTQSDLITAGCFDVGMAIQICENELNEYAKGKVELIDKISMIFNQKTQERNNCLAAYLSDEKVSGIKWISVFPNNPLIFNIPNISAMILLSDLETGQPVAIIEGNLCSSLRTAAVSAIAAKRLAKNNARCIGIIGAGEQAKMHFLAIKKMLPNLKICKVASRSSEREKNFITEMQQFHSDVEFIGCDSAYRSAVIDADVIVTAISGQEKILQGEWIKEGCFYCHVAGVEDDYSVVKKADKIVCDNWEAVKHRKQTISQMYKEGLLKDCDIYGDIHEIVCEDKEGRVNENEFIYFNSVGLPYLDIKLANSLRLIADRKGKGIKIRMRDSSMFVEEIERRKMNAK